MSNCLPTRAIVAVGFFLGLGTSAAQHNEIMYALLNFERTGVIYDGSIHIPIHKGWSLEPHNWRSFNLKVKFTDTFPERHDAQINAIARLRNAGSERYRDVPLWAVAGLPEREQKEVAITHSEQLLRHSIRFKLKGLPIRLKVKVVPMDSTKTMHYAPGQWAYVWVAYPSLAGKTSSFIEEEVDLSECLPETYGRYAINKNLLVLGSLQPGDSYRIQISNEVATPLPAGIVAILHLSRREIVK